MNKEIIMEGTIDHHEHDHCDCGHNYQEHDHCACGHDHHENETHHHIQEGTGKPTIFIIENLGCAHCAGKMEDQIRKLPGVEAATLTYATKQLRVWGNDVTSLLPTMEKICTDIEPGVTVTPRTIAEAKTAENKTTISEDTKDIICVILGAILFATGLVLGNFNSLYADITFILSYLVLGLEIVLTAIRNIAKGQVFDENFLMSIATIGAFAIGDFAEAVGVMLFYRIGELFESKAVARSRSQIMDVIDMRPEVVNIVTSSGDINIINAKDAKIGDIVQIRPGDRVPLDGVIIDGSTMIDTSAVTGEPVPVSSNVGDKIISGCVNTSGLIQMKVEKILEDSMVSRIMDSVENAAASKPKMDRFITRFSRIYTPFVVFLALATAIIPSLITGNWNHWVYTALTFLVISCPCALVLSVPLAFFSGIGAGSKQGILFKGGIALETLNHVKSIVMDKTGTITKGDFKLQEILPIGDISNNQLLSLAASCESGSTHPIGQSILAAANEKQISYNEAETVEEIAGHGVAITLNDHRILAGNQKLMNKHHVSTDNIASASYGTEVFLAQDDILLGRLIIADTLKDDAKDAIEKLKFAGLHTVMLTGDSQVSADAIARKTGIEKVYAKLLPDEKLEKLQEERQTNGSVMFVGDGINDAPVLAGADCGAAMGSGADAAIEAADVVFMTPRVSSIFEAIRIGKKSCSVAWQNVIVAIAIKVIVMILGLLGFANMWMAVFADTGVAMLCVLNSIRAMRN